MAPDKFFTPRFNLADQAVGKELEHILPLAGYAGVEIAVDTETPAEGDVDIDHQRSISSALPSLA